jgi:2-dehydropantoate 2-reductase
MARIALIGVGAIGGALAGLLYSTQKHQLTLCTRRPLPDLIVRTPEGEQHVEALNLTSTLHSEPVDWIIVSTKAYDAEGAASWFAGLSPNGAPIAIVQNGVEHRERFSPWIRASRLLPVVIDCPVERTAEGVVNVRGSVLMKTEDSPIGRSFLELFEGSSAHCVLTEDFTTAAWWKLCINVVGALNALTLEPGRVLWEDSLIPIERALVAECLAVARAEGAKLDESVIDEVINLYRCHPADSVNSLLADRLAGRHMEYDARNGAVVRKGAKHGIATPLNQMATALLEIAEKTRKI